MEVPYSADQLTALMGLSALHTLRLSADECKGTDGLNGLCQLTGLRKPQVSAPYDAPEEWLLQLTQFKQLTSLTYSIFAEFCGCRQTFRIEVSWTPISCNMHVCLRHAAVSETNRHICCTMQWVDQCMTLGPRRVSWMSAVL